MTKRDTRPWRKTIESLNVTYLWFYDTVAILDDYEDCEEGVLPEGEFLVEVERIQDGAKVVCDVWDMRRIEKRQIPKGRVRRFPPFAFVTPLQVIVSSVDIAERTIECQPPRLSWRARMSGSLFYLRQKKAAEPGATDNPDDAQRLREDH